MNEMKSIPNGIKNRSDILKKKISELRNKAVKLLN